MTTTMNSIVRTHQAALLAYATRVTGDQHLAEDVVQETWIRAWRHVDQIDTIHSLRPWLIRIVHNVAVDSHRRRRAQPTEVKLPKPELEMSAVQGSPCDEVETRIEVEAILDRLPAVHRDTLVEVYFADRTARSAASVLGVPVGTVKSRVHNALRVLRETLDQPSLNAA